MRAYVTGGATSGKSAFAESLAASLSSVRTYLATMEPLGTEAEARIERHRARRQHLGFRTVECPLSLADAGARACGGVALVEDVGNLAANALFEGGALGDEDEVRARLERELLGLCDTFDHVVVVGIEAGCAGPAHDAGTDAWLRLIGALGCAYAAASDLVVEVVSGVPHVLKGALP